MQSISTIGFDIAKSVFQVHGVDAAGQGRCAGSWSRPGLGLMQPESGLQRLSVRKAQLCVPKTQTRA